MCLGVGLGMLAGTMVASRVPAGRSGRLLAICVLKRILVLRARHHRRAGGVKERLFVGVCVSFVKTSQPRKFNGTGYPVRTHAFFV